MRGMVIVASAGNFIVRENGNEWICTARGNLKKDLVFSQSGSLPPRVQRAGRRRVSNTVTVGDQVIFESTGVGIGVIEAVEPRRTAVLRFVPRSRDVQVIAANIDLLLVVFAVSDPRLDPWKLDRYLVAARDSGLEPLVVVNKCDLQADDQVMQWLDIYERIGFDLIYASAVTGQGIRELQLRVAQQGAALTGPSGAGKSSLLNRLCPDAHAETGAVGAITHLGRHTTTMARVYDLPTGGWVADTPGLRSFELWDVDEQALLAGFPDVEETLTGCRFSNCSHRTEPGCPVLQALEDNRLDQRRYESFLALWNELRSRRA